MKRIDDEWRKSWEHEQAIRSWMRATYFGQGDNIRYTDFQQSEEYRQARYLFRKRVQKQYGEG